MVFSQVSVCSHFGGGGRYLPWMEGRGTYLGWGWVPTLMGGGVPTSGGGVVPTSDGVVVPTLERGGGTYLGWGEGYLPWIGYAAGSTPLAASRRRTF